MLTRKEREKLVIDLYNQGKTIRDIAKEVRMAFRDISTILKKASGETEKKHKESLSLSNKAYRLFSKDKTPIQVAITLNLSEAETKKFYQEYWNLKQMHELKMAYEEIGSDIKYFLALYRLSKDAHMNPQQVVNLLHIANNDMRSVEQRYQKLQRNVKLLESRELDLSINLEDLNSQIENAKQTLQFYRRCNEKEVGKILQLHKQNVRIATLMTRFKNSNKEYNKIQFVANQTVKNVLSDKRQLLKLAVYALIESWHSDPTKFNFLVHSMSPRTTISKLTSYDDSGDCHAIHSSPYYNQNRYAENLIELIANEAADLYEKMVKEFTNETMAACTYSDTSIIHLDERTNHIQVFGS
jgi:hypothetical protein